MPKIKVLVNVEGFNVTTYIEKTMTRIGNLSEPLKKGGNVMLASVDRNFRESGRPRRWRRLSIGTLRQKQRLGYSNLPLIRTGQLRRSVVFKTTRTELRIGTNVPYAQYHQYGTRSIPARPFLVFQRKDIQDIERLVFEHITGKRRGL